MSKDRCESENDEVAEQGDLDTSKDVKKIYDSAMRLLVRREHARAELLRKLIRRDFDAVLCEGVLDRLIEEGSLSDARFAHAYSTYRRERGFGPLRIHEELRQRGVDAALREESCPAEDPEWATRASDLRRRRFGEALPSDFQDKARQHRFLTQRGFTHHQVSIALQWASPTGD